MNSSAKRIGFGIQTAQDAADYATVRAFWQEAEKLGYDSVWLCDHVFPVATDRKAQMLEAWTTLAALAAQTTQIRVGTLVLCAGFRPPALVAKMAATLDVITNGRLEFGIGAGWFEPEYVAYGYDFPRAAERIGRMDEAVEVCKRMWTDDSPTFQGKYFRIDGAFCEPKPVQKPHPPIWVGGGGEQLTLKAVAKHADKWSCLSLTPAEVVHKIEVLNRHCSKIGRDPDEIEKTWYGTVMVDDDEQKIKDTLERRASRRNQSVEEFTKRMIAGTPEQCVAKIESYLAAGITYFTVNMGSLRDLRTPRVFAEKVMPHFGR